MQRLTYEDVAELDRRGTRLMAIHALMQMEVGQRFALRHALPFGRRYREMRDKAPVVSANLSFLLSVPQMAEFDPEGARQPASV